MRSINILATQRISTADRAKIEAADPAVQLIDAGGWFDGEIRETFTAYAAARYLAPHSTGSGSREERDRLLAEAEVILGGWPFPLALCARAPRLKWLHQRQAGLAQVQHVPLHHAPAADPRVLDNAPIAVLLAILPAKFAAQEHDGRQLSAYWRP